MVAEFAIVLPLLLMVTNFCSADPPSNLTQQEFSLRKRLLAFYYRGPGTTYVGEVVNVTISLNLIAVHHLDGYKQSMSSQVFLKQTWNDPQLVWDPSDVSGIDKMRFEASDIWVPGINLANSMTSPNVQSSAGMPRVTSTGDVVYTIPLQLESKCQMDLLHWPYDKQTCTLSFCSDIYTSDEVRLNLANNVTQVNLSNYYRSMEFKLLSTDAKTRRDYYVTDDAWNTCIDFRLTLERITTYYTHLLVAPSVVTSLIIPVIFLLPTESNEKTIFGVGLLITHTINFAQLELKFPSFSFPIVPYITAYFLANIVLVCMALVLGALVCAIWQKAERKTPVPVPIRMVFLGVFGRVFRSSREDYLPDDISASAAKRLEKEAKGEEFKPASPAEHAEMVRTYSSLTNKAEWKQLAVVLDRLFFVIFLLTIIIINLVYRF